MKALKLAAGCLLVVSFCAGTVGAAGMKEKPEPWAGLLFSVGLAGVVAGGVISRLATRLSSTQETEVEARREAFRGELERLRALVARLDDEKAGLSTDEARRRIERLLSGEFFDFTSRHEEVIRLLGFTSYARVWEGVAAAERLLARAWSMATDGHLAEALEELPAARAELGRAAGVFAVL